MLAEKDSSYAITITDNIHHFNIVEYLLNRNQIIKTDNISEIAQNFMATEHHKKKDAILNDLLYNNYEETKYKCKNDQNTRMIKDVFDIVKQLPPILNITKTKPEIPIFDEIEVYKEDSAEIKKFIRKINMKMLGYSCNHKTIDEKCDGVIKSITDFIDSKEFICYRDFLDRGVKHILYILDHNQNGDENHLPFGSTRNTYMYTDCFYDDVRVNEVVDAIIKLNGKISGSNSKTNKRCNKCEATIRLYNYSIKEVARMREELAEQKEIDAKYETTPDEMKYEIRDFLNNNYPSINRFLLKDVKDKYKATFKININMEQLQKQIEDTGLFTISNSHNIKYVNRK